jgi:peptidyl-tRNA hydrolase, PTH1 family
MALIVGLGNPGRFYASSRHSIGFTVVKALVKKLRASLKRDTGTGSLSGKVRIGGQESILALPATFMNLSGRPTALLVKKYKVELKDVLVVCDDLDLELGRLKIKPSGSSGGHRGLASVIEALGDKDFARLRIGIGRPSPGMDAPDYVLSRFNRAEMRAVNKAVKEACACCETWLTQGIDKTMNIFNTRSSKHEEI